MYARVAVYSVVVMGDRRQGHSPSPRGGGGGGVDGRDRWCVTESIQSINSRL